MRTSGTRTVCSSTGARGLGTALIRTRLSSSGSSCPTGRTARSRSRTSAAARCSRRPASRQHPAPRCKPGRRTDWGTNGGTSPTEDPARRPSRCLRSCDCHGGFAFRYRAARRHGRRVSAIGIGTDDRRRCPGATSKQSDGPERVFASWSPCVGGAAGRRVDRKASPFPVSGIPWSFLGGRGYMPSPEVFLKQSFGMCRCLRDPMPRSPVSPLRASMGARFRRNRLPTSPRPGCPRFQRVTARSTSHTR